MVSDQGYDKAMKCLVFIKDFRHNNLTSLHIKTLNVNIK